ncbi:MAG: N-acetylglucosamine kinase, partial [Chitinophagaceae bacterium]|nr:N-acetylglucosamine kinase [Chitinophagaceae bacterium]
MKLIADSGATKTTWTLVGGNRQKTITTAGISPYFFTPDEIAELLLTRLLPKLGGAMPQAIHFYGTGCATPDNQQLVKKGIRAAFKGVKTITVESDLTAAARALCGHTKGIACILGTGSNSCVYNGKRIVRNNPAPGFILGDEGSGAYLGKKTVQYFIYQTFDEDLMHKFQLRFGTNYREILQHVYKEPWPNRYLAGFAPFLSENRGHYMIENIVEDGLSDFIHTHLYKYPETWT